MKLQDLRKYVTLRPVIRKRPGRKHFEAGDRHRDAKQWEDAASAYAAGLAVAPDAFGMWVQLGHALKEGGQLGKAEAAYLRALALNSEDPDLHINLGHFYTLTRDRAKACLHYERAVGIGSHDFHALVRLADDARDRADWAAAARWYEQALGVVPAAAAIRVQYGHALKEIGYLRRAEAAYLRALETLDHTDDLHLQLGHLYSLLKESEKAAKHYTAAARGGSAIVKAAGRVYHSNVPRVALLDTETLELLASLLPQDGSMAQAGSDSQPASFAQHILRALRQRGSVG